MTNRQRRVAQSQRFGHPPPPFCLTSFWPSPCSPCPAKFIYSLITLRRNVRHTVLAPLLCGAPVCRHTETLASAITLVRDQLKTSRLLLPPLASGLLFPLCYVIQLYRRISSNQSLRNVVTEILLEENIFFLFSIP